MEFGDRVFARFGAHFSPETLHRGTYSRLGAAPPVPGRLSSSCALRIDLNVRLMCGHMGLCVRVCACVWHAGGVKMWYVHVGRGKVGIEDFVQTICRRMAHFSVSSVVHKHPGVICALHVALSRVYVVA